MKIFLRIPTPGQIEQEVVKWYGWINRQLPDADISTTYTACYGIAEGRNLIVQEFLQSDCTHLWMVDSDVVPPYTTKLLEGADKHPIICGPYHGNMGQGGILWHVYTHLRVDENGKHYYGSMRRKDWPKERWFPADAAGTGCMLIRRDVFESGNLRPFAFVFNADGTVGTEDYPFCREHGGVMIDQHYCCHHLRISNLAAIAHLTDSVQDNVSNMIKAMKRLKG